MHPLEQLRDDALRQIAAAADERIARERAREISSDAAAAFPHGATR